ncbi:MAG: hypothetical protein AABX33_02360 [Nanoarchaeota archaeon]
MKKIPLSLILVLVFLPIVYADITLLASQNTYNLGNEIAASASALQDKNFEGLFKIALLCNNYKLEYFLTPISLDANFRTAISVPELIVTSAMLGDCLIKGEILTNDNLIIEQKESNSFNVTAKLNIVPAKSHLTSSPGAKIQLAGAVNGAFGNNVLKAVIIMELDNSSHNLDLVDGNYNVTIEIPKNIKSGIHPIWISATDTKGNSGTASVKLEIISVPTYVSLELKDKQVAPGSKTEILASLFDQHNDLINSSLDLELTSPEGDKIFKKRVQSGEKIVYEFSQYAEPGSYLLSSSYENLISKASLNITSIREVKIKYENETVFIENIGNVPFKDELTFFLESDLKKYPVTKSILVEPSKILSLDLSKEVPFGIYDVLATIKEGITPIKEKLNQTVSSLFAGKESILANDVTIHDNRPMHKKIASALSSISGALIGSDGILAKSPLLAPMILVSIGVLVIFRYGRKPIMRLIKGKKNEEAKSKED